MFFSFFLYLVKSFETKNRDSRNSISQNLFNFSIRESLSREISSICQIAKVYPKKFASFWTREKFLSRKFLRLKYLVSRNDVNISIASSIQTSWL